MKRSADNGIPRLTRRELGRLGALTISGFRLMPLANPFNVEAAERVQPRGSANCVIFLNLQGGPSQMDTFDVKEGKWGPENRDVRKTPQGYQFPYGLLPRTAGQLDDIALVRSMEAWETVHSRGQYYLQTGHAVSPARIHETPSLGSIIAYESKAARRESDYLPSFIAMNYEPTTMYGPLAGEGCLPGDCAPLTMDFKSKTQPFVVEEKDKARFARRWELLNRLDPPQTGAVAQPERQYAAFRNASHRMMENPAIGKVMELTAEERKAYGSTPFGDACIIARNMAEANAGARFIFVTHPGWDQHANLYGKNSTGGIYKLCAEFDGGYAALLADLKRSKLLERTLVVAMGEFGRTPGDLSPLDGREHYAKAMFAAFAGAGVKGGRAIGATDEQAGRVVDFGWGSKRPIYTEDVCATLYSSLGIDWTKRITHTPSGRDFVYVDPAAGQSVVNFREISELFG